ncbi:hypothetical protein EDB83DRAFT_2532493 [Lactarius deliciosus]|nr:hypothetical protein EDB83DRAFT_2532493 [Lactarius deliciosus]
MSSLIVYQGKMTAGTYMVDENLYVVFPSGIKDGALAYVLGTWTKDASGIVNSPLTMVGYPLKLITNKEFYIVKNGEYYHLKVDVSGDKINVILLNERDEPSSEPSTLSVLQLPVPLTLRARLSITDDGGLSFFPSLYSQRPSNYQAPWKQARSSRRSPRAQAHSRTSSLGSSATCSGAGGGGEWMYCLRSRTLRWFLTPSSAIPGTTRPASAPGRAATLRVTVLKIDQLKLSGETYKPYKGVRCGASGEGPGGKEDN